MIDTSAISKSLRDRRNALRLQARRVDLADGPEQSADEVDAAVECGHVELDCRLTAASAVELREIEDALLRLDDGTYGMCEDCGEPISAARLEAMPAAALCLECKMAAEARGETSTAGSDWLRLGDLADDGPVDSAELSFSSTN